MPDWINDFEHAGVTTENRGSFNTSMEKYETPDDAIVGNFNQQKVMGKPFRMPESMDKLPDDASRGDFTAQAHKLLGIEHAKDVEGLADINMKAGQTEGAAFDENLAASFKQFVVEQKLNKNESQKYVEFFNQTLAKVAQVQEASKLDAAKTCNEALVAHPDFGSEEKVKEMSELMRRAIFNNVGLTPEEAEQMGNEMTSEITRHPVMARVMLKVLAPLAQEGNTESGDGTGGGSETKQASPYEAKKSRWPNSPPSEWGEPSDKWENQDVQTRKALGYKEK